MKRTEFRHLYPCDRPARPLGFDGGDGGDGDGEETKEFKLDLDDPKIKAAVDAAVDSAVQGLKAKNGEVLGENKDLKTKLREIEGTWGDH